MYPFLDDADDMDVIIFENLLRENCVNRSKVRFNKFFKLLVSLQLPWYVSQSMLDLFPRIETYFFTSKRTNFINMGQLGIEMCRHLGYPEYIPLFIPLKTRSRVNLANEFVKIAINDRCSGNIPLCRLEDLKYIPLGNSQEPVDLSRVGPTRVYTDKATKKK